MKIKNSKPFLLCSTYKNKHEHIQCPNKRKDDLKFCGKHKNIKDTLNSIYKNKIIQSYKNDSEIDAICNSYTIYKNYFINPPVQNITMIEFNKPNINELTKLLVTNVLGLIVF